MLPVYIGAIKKNRKFANDFKKKTNSNWHLAYSYFYSYWFFVLLGIVSGIIITLIFMELTYKDFNFNNFFAKKNISLTVNKDQDQAQQGGEADSVNHDNNFVVNNNINKQKPVFEFYNELAKNNTSNVLKNDKSPINCYLIQLGSFKKRDDAESLKAKLIINGFEAHIDEVKLAEQLWHRVIMGPFESEEQALEHQKQLLPLQLKNTLIITKKN